MENLSLHEAEEFTSDEDRIINNLVIEGNNRLFDDTDFLPIRQSLYTNVSNIPEYDGDTFHRVVWCRPSLLNDVPEYFNSTSSSQYIGCIQKTLPDEVFIGALMGVAAYLKRDLLENIIASKPHDFKTYGIYTCRFYVEGEWVDVITDTNLPCLRDENSGDIALAYSQSVHAREMWIPFIEKAYAKAVGSYEAIQKVRVHEALLHLTGGSVQQVSFHDTNTNTGTSQFSTSGSIYKYLNRLSNDDTLIFLVPINKSQKEKDRIDLSQTAVLDAASLSAAADESSRPGTSSAIDNSNKIENYRDESQDNFADVTEMFHSNRMYSVIACRSIGGYELVLLHNPWGNHKQWTGSWSDSSNDWELYPEILEEIENDKEIPWKRQSPNGYFWMTGKMVQKYFNVCYSVKLFNNDKFSFYCVKGEWKEKTAGGSINLVREKINILKDAQASNLMALQKATPVNIIDGDISWFNNPQYRIQVAKPCMVYVSILPTSGSEDNKTHTMTLTITSMSINNPNYALQKHLWESVNVDIVATVKSDCNPRVKGQETSIWSVEFEPSKIYHIVPHTHRPGLEGAFIVRIFSTEPIVVEKVPLLETKTTHGGWTKSGDIDTTGGPINTKKDNIIKENAKWCQNPQYHLEMTNPFSKEDIFLKIVLKRFDRENKNSTIGTKTSGNKASGKQTPGSVNNSSTPGGAGGSGFNDKEYNVGLVVCRAECLEEAKAEAIRKKRAPKENIFGEIMIQKESTLKRGDQTLRSLSNTAGGMGGYAIDLPPGSAAQTPHAQTPHTATSTALTTAGTSADEIKTILRKISVEKEAFYIETSCSSKNDTTIFFPKLPRSWMPHGIIIVPFLSEKNVKSNFELDIFCSETFKLTHIPDSYSRCVAGEWKEGMAGGSHILPATWKKNPKYNLKVRNSSFGAATNVRISLHRFGSKWRGQCKKDTVGCMIGFYVFRNKAGELTQIFESNFVPVDENVTEPSLQLGVLAQDEVYTIMPTTFGEGKFGTFILNVMSERDFTLKLDK